MFWVCGLRWHDLCWALEFLLFRLWLGVWLFFRLWLGMWLRLALIFLTLFFFPLLIWITTVPPPFQVCCRFHILRLFFRLVRFLLFLFWRVWCLDYGCCFCHILILQWYLQFCGFCHCYCNCYYGGCSWWFDRRSLFLSVYLGQPLFLLGWSPVSGLGLVLFFTVVDSAAIAIFVVVVVVAVVVCIVVLVVF